ncbi:hypothetical protein [Microbacterium sp. NPDC056234]|uniref:hypothetical protein n=1 Tax=Microbacterium sp. NPDC056234 TaxID=3345757 RepID=UPI0035D5B9E6
MTRGFATCGPVRIAWSNAADATAAGLSPDDRTRYEQLSPSRAMRFLAGRALLTQLVHDLGEPDARLSTRCDNCGSTEHGRVHTVTGSVFVSISYAGGLAFAAAASAEDTGAIGVDAEPDSGAGALHELAPLFAPAPPPDIHGWTLIEAAVKADGRGLRIPVADVRLRTLPGHHLPGGRIVQLPPDRRIEAAPVSGPDGFVLSVAIDPARGSGR